MTTPDNPENEQALWRQFENLATRLIRNELKITPTQVYVTQASRDGGYDGEIVYQVADDAQDGLGALTFRIFLEAKIRTGQQGIGLRDFAATLVIAHNAAARTLVVVANRHFTEQAITHAKTFFSKTNLDVRLVDGPTVSGWVRRRRNQLAREFPAKLLDMLTLENPDEEKSREYRAAADTPGSRKTPSRDLVVETGWREDGAMADCRLRFLPDERHAPAAPPPLLSDARRRLASDLATAMSASAAQGGVFTLFGAGGVGKSVLVDHVLHGLSTSATQDAPPWVERVDVSKSISSRTLFTHMLKALYGFDPSELVADTEDAWKPEALIDRLGGADVEEAMRNAVVSTLQSNSREYSSSLDLNIEPLLGFLGVVASNLRRGRAIALVFHELNKSSSENLEFLLQAARLMAQKGVVVLLEVRHEGFQQHAHTRDDHGLQSPLSQRQWDAYVQQFKALADNGVFQVNPPQPAEAHAYLESMLPGLGDERAAVITRHVGFIPLHLRLTAAWLKEERILARPHESGVFLVEDLERFFGEHDIAPHSVATIFSQVIAAWWSREEPAFRQCLAAAGLLQGRLPFEAVTKLAEGGDPENIADKLIDSGLFALATDTMQDLEASHDLIREQMAQFRQGRSPTHALVARKLLPHLDTLYTHPLTRTMREVDLLSVLGQDQADRMHGLAYTVANELATTRDWSMASTYFAKACEALGGCTGAVRGAEEQLKELRTLADWLEVEVLRYRIGSEENFNRLSALLTLLNFPGHLDPQSAEHKTLRIRAAILEWRYHFVQEKFDDALAAAERGREIALEDDAAVDLEVRGKALSNHAVTLKVKDRREESLAAFEEARKRLPLSYTVEAERLSNIAAFALRDDPNKALACYRELLEVTRNTEYSFSEIIHAHVDIAMADFLQDELHAAERDAHIAIKLAMDNGVPAEEARGRNILGCAYWAQNRVMEADEAFNKAALASERSISHRFLWRMRTNAAGTAVERGDYEAAYSLARSAENAVLTPREGNFAHVETKAVYLTARWYAALLAIGEYYSMMGKNADVQRLRLRVALPHFNEHLDAFLEGTPPPAVFARTTHLKAGRIMITG